MRQYHNLANLPSVINSSKELQDIYLPIFFKIESEDDRALFFKLKELYPFLKIYDKILSQIRELIILRNPSRKLNENELKDCIDELLAGKDMLSYGSWVYYSWDNSLVHVLDENEFFEVRTSRNLYKITKEEQKHLANKIVGVIGLSVGQSIAITIAIERVCGELRLADFDKIELSNLNRIRTGVKNLNLPKAIIAAREIVSIDPYINVKCFTDGLTYDNIDDFIFNGGSKIDLIVEECDSVDIKILSRIKAKSHRIPVVMDTNDRGMIDIERFDLDPEYPILHGLVSNLDFSSIRDLSVEEKIKVLGPIADVENMSPRMKYSLSEIGKSITTWPQLASSVMLGGAIVTDTVRRIFLGELQKSGRYFVDIEQIIR